jgi:CheY-like chemotaxis protein/anti-sigma regulatory factor (Ser/Thr protein kinase)
MKAKKLKTLQSAFIRNVEHELRSPLTIIQGYSELLSEGAIGSLAPEQERAIGAINNQVRELRAFVERITTFMAVTTLVVAIETFDLKNIVTQVVEAQRSRAEQAGLTLAVQLSATPLWVKAQAYHLQQAVDCLVDNALKFTPPNGQVEIKVYTETNWICLSVADTGIGIEEAELEYIFDSFYQVDGSSTREYGGVGLGLAVAKAVVEAYAGQLSIESQLGRGSRFTIKMPAASPVPKLNKLDKMSQKQQRILIVDDEEFVALTMQAGLENLPNCEVLTATSGEQAWQFFEEKPFNLLITDYKMPGIDGLTLAAQIKQAYPQTIIIMMTAYGGEELNEQAANISIQRILDKPVEFSEVRRVASEALSSAEDHQAIL